MTRTLGRLIATLAVVLLPASASALPRFAVQFGAPCSMCHANPTGGGARNAYGRGPFARQSLAMNQGTPNGGFPNIDPTIGEWLSLGMDLRAAFTASIPRANVPDSRALELSHSFLPLQADLYLVAEPSPYFDIYYDQGTFGSQEIYVRPRLGILSLKAGKFVPAYGWRLVDHTAYTREALGFGPRSRDTGMSLLLEHPNLSVELGTFAGAGSEVFMDVDKLRAYSGRAEGRLLVGRLRFHLGASGYWNLAGGGETRTETIRFGAFGGIGLGRLAWLFEVDGAVDEALGKRVTGTAAYNELSVVLLRGLQVGLIYDFRDPDADIRGDALHRLGLDVSLLPWPATELELIVRNTGGNPGNPNARLIDVTLVLHGYL